MAFAVFSSHQQVPPSTMHLFAVAPAGLPSPDLSPNWLLLLLIICVSAQINTSPIENKPSHPKSPLHSLFLFSSKHLLLSNIWLYVYHNLPQTVRSLRVGLLSCYLLHPCIRIGQMFTKICFFFLDTRQSSFHIPL